MSDEEKLKYLIINGERGLGQGRRKQSLEEILESVLLRYTPLELINTVLLDGMKTVGELFGARKMQLPSVLDSAATMKAAVAYLEPKMEKAEGNQRGTIVLATVKGDVHDIGKNLVDIILSNNGYKVVNLGIKQPANVIIEAAKEHNADAIGLSGLLVKSTLEMKYVIHDLQLIQSQIPVICGGAALTRKYVEDDLRKEYSSAVFYAEDAFAGLHVMSDLTDADESVRAIRLSDGATRREFNRPGAAEHLASLPPATTERSSIVKDVEEIPVPPFFGVRTRRDFDLNELYKYINETALFKNQWQLKTASATDYLRLVEEKFRPILKELEQEVIANEWFDPKTVYGWFPAQSEGNEVIVYDPDERNSELLRIDFPAAEGGTAAVHRGLLLAEVVRAHGCDWLLGGNHRQPCEPGNTEALRGRRLHQVSLPAWAFGGDGRSAGGVYACCDAQGIGHRRRGCARRARSVPPEVPWLALLVWLSSVPQPGGPGQDIRTAEAGGEDQRAPDRGVPHRARAEHECADCSSSAGEVLCGVAELLLMARYTL